MPRPDVTICIPAWQAEPFIGRTLDCARSQSHANIRILVSVDRCEDATERICREHAAHDARIEVISQPRRLGWSENANALLDRVDTEFYCLYFHDDIIEPSYVARLRDALLEQPEAKSAHCDLERFGHVQGIDPGNHYAGSACRRLLNYMMGPIKGTPLRSLTRSELLDDGLRFPDIGDGGFWRCHPFVFHLLAAGAALHVPEVLYRRWIRVGSMTSLWDAQSAAPLIEGQRAGTAHCLRIIDRASSNEHDRQLLRFALYLFTMNWTRREELRLGGDHLIDPTVISPTFADQRAPESLAWQPADIQSWLGTAQQELLALEDRFHSVTRDRPRDVAC